MRQPRLLTLILCAAALFSGCGSTRQIELPPYEGTGRTDRGPTDKEELLARSDFSLEVARLTDSRRPRSTAFEVPDQIIYEYEPDNLIQGLVFRGPVLLNKYLTYRPRTAKHYFVEVDVKRLDTYIATGKLLFGGRDGRYIATMEFEALVRRADSQIALRRTYRIENKMPRVSHNGRHPSKELDRAAMYDLVEDGFRKFAEQLAWDVRQNDARHWKMDDTTNIPGIPVEMRPAVPMPAEPTPAAPVNMREVPQNESLDMYQNKEDFYGNQKDQFLPPSDPISGSVLIPTQG